MPVMDRVIQRSEGAVQDDNQNMKHPQQDNGMEGLTPHFQDTFRRSIPNSNAL